MAGPERSDEPHAVANPAPEEHELHSSTNLPVPGWALPNETPMSSPKKDDDQPALDIQMPHVEEQPSNLGYKVLENLGRLWHTIHSLDNRSNEVVSDQTLEGAAPSRIFREGNEQKVPEGQDMPSDVNLPGIFQNIRQPWTTPSENTPGALGISMTSEDPAVNFDESDAPDHLPDVFQDGLKQEEFAYPPALVSSSLSKDWRSEDSEVEVLDQPAPYSERQENQSESQMQPSSNGLKSVLKNWAERIGFFSFGALIGSQATHGSSSQTPASHQFDRAILMRSIILFPAIFLTGYSFGQWIRRDQPICFLACLLVWIFSAILFWCSGQ